MFILLIGCHCKYLLNLQTVQMCGISRRILQWAPNEQNQHFKELREKVGIEISGTVIPKGLPSLDRKYTFMQ